MRMLYIQEQKRCRAVTGIVTTDRLDDEYDLSFDHVITCVATSTSINLEYPIER